MGNEQQRERSSQSDRNNIDGQLVPRRPQGSVAVGTSRAAVHMSSRTAAIVTGDGQIAIVREERTVIVSSREKPQFRRAIGCESVCSYTKYGKESVEQDWYQCHTCWGGDSSFGCCQYCAKTCHKGHELVYRGSVGGYCDCGVNSHKAAVCTFHSTGSKHVKQPFYHCYSCFPPPKDGAAFGCCYQCMKHCHAGHLVNSYEISTGAYCDCGLPCCKITCKIPSP